jgi:hypothetical protein
MKIAAKMTRTEKGRYTEYGLEILGIEHIRGNVRSWDEDQSRDLERQFGRIRGGPKPGAAGQSVSREQPRRYSDCEKHHHVQIARLLGA